MVPKDSKSDPLRIATLEFPAGGGRIGMTLCPGKYDPDAMSGSWERDLPTDLQAIQKWGADGLVTLLEDHEFELLKVPDLGASVQRAGVDWFHLPIRDSSAPDERFDEAWPDAKARLLGKLRAGESVVIHCRGGLGRTGVVAGLLLIEEGVAPADALTWVRELRRGAVETLEQERYLLGAGK